MLNTYNPLTQSRKPCASTILILGFGLLLLVSGCASDHLGKFYVDATHGAPIPKELKKYKPMAYFTQGLQAEVTRLVKQEGFTIVGYSDYFTSEPPTIQDLQRKGQEVGATTVVCQTHYRETVTEYRPMFNYVPGTTATYDSSGTVTANGTANFYGTGWTGYGTSQANGSYSSSATASTPDRLEYAGSAPYNVRLYDVGAVFCRDPRFTMATRPERLTGNTTPSPDSSQPHPPSELTAATKEAASPASESLPTGSPLEQFETAQDYDAEGKYFEAVKWFLKAAEGGLPDAQFAVGVHYRYGMGIKENRLSAYKWTSVALSHPPTKWRGPTDDKRLAVYKAALETQVSLRASLSPEEISEADAFLNQIKAKLN